MSGPARDERRTIAANCRHTQKHTLGYQDTDRVLNSKFSSLDFAICRADTIRTRRFLVLGAGVIRMNLESLEFASPYFLDLIENQGVTGTWSWGFPDNHHVWSPGLFRVLGLDPQTTRPGYERLLGLIHPQDRERVETRADLIQGVTFGQKTVRLLRPDGAIRVLSVRCEIYLTPDGRPRGAAGVVLDVTDQERLQQARMAEQRRWRALFNERRTLFFSSDLVTGLDFTQEFCDLTGLSASEIATDAFQTITHEEREHWRAHGGEAFSAGLAYRATPLLRIMRHGRERFESFVVPIRSSGGEIREWAGITRPMGSMTSPVSDQFREGLEQAIDGRHLRAARALLDWSMT
ncbi:PAS domain-containing protein, partial [Methylobacterium sp. Leaf89]|uniref:PAS domain-containing protein n=1 Tax=Methylobacterium sp. Leaf89 TaxID=1736245 RepID=UPI000B1B8804